MPAETQSHFLAQIKTQSGRVQTIIQNMLGLAALEHQQQLEHLTEVDVADLVRTQIAHLNDKASRRKVQFRLITNITPKIKAEAFLLGQAIYNVLENALDFSPENAHININISQTNNSIAISVHDQGSGIPDYAIDKVFHKFYSLPRPATGQKSTGLGLNFVQEVLKLHGGNIQLKNHPDGGALAVISLPKN
jgi:two-component system sensor histidine kinase CreC